MTPKEKARQLFKKYSLLSWKGKEFEFEYYKQCALIAVDEIIIAVTKQHNDMTWSERKQVMDRNIGVNYWKQVKQEIEKL
jgi:hypothetical protein